MDYEDIINKTKAFVQECLKDAEGGHDWWHILRVWKNTLAILKEEPLANNLVCELAALLHDIADPKFHNGDEEKGPNLAKKFLNDQLNLKVELQEEVIYIIKNLSFSTSLLANENLNKILELQIVQDADRLDAMGAIGIARAFNFGGFKNREIYNPLIPPVENIDKESYMRRNGPTLNHFYEKLLLLKDQINTKTAKRLADNRHEFMLLYLEQFYKEWGEE